MTNTLNKIIHNGDEYLLPRQKALVITLTSAWWTNNEQTVTATWVTANNSIIISPVPTDISDYTDAKIYCSAQGTDSLIFTCDTAPSNDIEVNVLVLSAEVGSTPTPTPSMISCDFTQGDQWFSITEARGSTYGRDSNGFYYKSESPRWGGCRLLIPSSITSQWTPKQIKLYGENLDVWSWIWISEWVDTKFLRVFNNQLNCYSGTGAWGTPNNTNVSPLNDDVFVIDLENEVCYLESATSTTATIYPSTVLTLWNNNTLNLCLLSPNSNYYGYLQKAEFYF